MLASGVLGLNLSCMGVAIQGAGIITEGWPYKTSCLALLGEVGPAGVVCIDMDGLYRLPPAGSYPLAGSSCSAVSSCCYEYMINVHDQPPTPKSRTAGRVQLSILKGLSF